MAERRRRKRIKYYAMGGVVVCLLFYLGDQSGWFQVGDGAPAGGMGRREGPESHAGAVSSDRWPEPRAAGLGTADPRPVEGPADAQVADHRGLVSEVGQADAVTADSKPPSTSTQPRVAQPSEAARLDAALGMIDELEHLLRREELAELASLKSSLQVRPIEIPAKLSGRWQELWQRVDAALACGPRLRELLRSGRILAARHLVASLLDGSAPAWLRQDLDQAVAKFGWPAFSRRWQVDGSSVVAGTPLDKHRRIRFRHQGRIQRGRVWSHDGRQTTVRVSGAAGYRYPKVDRHRLEPIDPTPDEALRQGLAAAVPEDALTVLLWSCHLQETGRMASARRLRELLR